ncbi:hypothetical protein L596_002422 [Steinernema carpocapsae]|uniref:Secreted protein n=1 Tax=Steinernema carpocapsae TaxID=34508 RepID=A0A4U8UR20_STECR|nr:hypothetical protein L596_002422 [Steinernema carpocapsae]
MFSRLIASSLWALAMKNGTMMETGSTMNSAVTVSLILGLTMENKAWTVAASRMQNSLTERSVDSILEWSWARVCEIWKTDVIRITNMRGVSSQGTRKEKRRATCVLCIRGGLGSNLPLGGTIC